MTKAPYERGYDAYDYGWKPEQNPYRDKQGQQQLPSYAASEWIAGWNDRKNNTYRPTQPPLSTEEIKLVEGV